MRKFFLNEPAHFSNSLCMHISANVTWFYSLFSLGYMQSAAKKFSLVVTFSWMKQKNERSDSVARDMLRRWVGDEVCVSHDLSVSFAPISFSYWSANFHSLFLTPHTLDTVPIGTWQIFNGFLMVCFKKFNNRWIFCNLK